MGTERLANGWLAEHCPHTDVVTGQCIACGFSFSTPADSETEPKPDDAGEAREEAPEQEAPQAKDAQEPVA